ISCEFRVGYRAPLPAQNLREVALREARFEVEAVERAVLLHDELSGPLAYRSSPLAPLLGPRFSVRKNQRPRTGETCRRVDGVRSSGREAEGRDHDTVPVFWIGRVGKRWRRNDRLPGPHDRTTAGGRETGLGGVAIAAVLAETAFGIDADRVPGGRIGP